MLATPCLACWLGHVSDLALLMQFTTETPLRYPQGKGYSTFPFGEGGPLAVDEVFSRALRRDRVAAKLTGEVNTYANTKIRNGREESQP